MESRRNRHSRFFFISVQFSKFLHKSIQEGVGDVSRSVEKKEKELSAIPYEVEVFEHRKQWEDLWWVLADNDIIKLKEIKGLEVVQFYNFLARWKETMKKKLNK